jgi:hypothetical protein
MGFDPPKPVIPAKAGIHDLTISQHFVEEKSWIPAFAGMTAELPRVRPQVSWYNTSPPETVALLVAQ